MRKILLAGAAVLLLLSLASPSLAANGNGKGKGGGGQQATAEATITLDQTDPHYGDSVSFSATYPPMSETALVWLACSQAGQVVFQFGGIPGGWFPLGGAGVSSAWTGGDADCIATLYYNTYQGKTQTGQVILKSTPPFHVWG